jgi:hypothetical protein
VTSGTHGGRLPGSTERDNYDSFVAINEAQNNSSNMILKLHSITNFVDRETNKY